MTPVIIADKAALAEARRKRARVLTFEDGISRVIILTARQWNNYEAALSGGFTPEELLWIAFDTAKEAFENGRAPDFEEELRLCVTQMADNAWTSTELGRRQQASNWGAFPPNET